MDKPTVTCTECAVWIFLSNFFLFLFFSVSTAKIDFRNHKGNENPHFSNGGGEYCEFILVF